MVISTHLDEIVMLSIYARMPKPLVWLSRIKAAWLRLSLHPLKYCCGRAGNFHLQYPNNSCVAFFRRADPKGMQGTANQDQDDFINQILNHMAHF